MSESLRNDRRVWVPVKKGDWGSASQIPEDERDYYLERRYPSFGNLVPRDVAPLNAKTICDEGRGVGETKLAIHPYLRDAIARLGKHTIKERYGNLAKCTAIPGALDTGRFAATLISGKRQVRRSSKSSTTFLNSTWLRTLWWLLLPRGDRKTGLL